MTLTTMHVDRAQEERAPDGSTVYVLAGIDEAGTAIFELAPGDVARPVRHPRVQEVWYVLSGHGRIWRRSQGGEERMDDLLPGTSLNIPRHTTFQFRSDGTQLLRILGVTAPPWKGNEDAEALTAGKWKPTL